MSYTCPNCEAKERIDANRRGLLTGRIEAKPQMNEKQYSNRHGPGWHREPYWHSEAALGHNIPKERVKR